MHHIVAYYCFVRLYWKSYIMTLGLMGAAMRPWFCARGQPFRTPPFRGLLCAVQFAGGNVAMQGTVQFSMQLWATQLSCGCEQTPHRTVSTHPLLRSS